MLPSTPSVQPGPAYRYLDSDLNVVHTTSAPRNDTEALHYFHIVSDWFKGTSIVFIEKCEIGETKYHFMQYEFDGKEAKSLV